MKSPKETLARLEREYKYAVEQLKRVEENIYYRVSEDDIYNAPHIFSDPADWERRNHKHWSVVKEQYEQEKLILKPQIESLKNQLKSAKK